MTRHKRFLLLFVLLVIGGCLYFDVTTRSNFPPEMDGNLVFFDVANQPIAFAQFDLPKSIPAMGGKFEGTYQFTCTQPDFPSVESLPGRYFAMVFDQWITFDLTPGMADNNVYFHGQFKGNQLRGTWGYATFAGGKEMGTVILKHEHMW